VVDASSADAELMIQAVQDTLKEIGTESKPVIMVFNKTDHVSNRPDSSACSGSSGVGRYRR